MKNVILTTTFASMFAFSAAVSAAEDIHSNQVKVPYYGDQQTLNEHNNAMFKKRMEIEDHLQGSIDDNRGRIDHLQRSDNNHNEWTQRQEDRLNQHDEDIDSLDGRVETVSGRADTADRERQELYSSVDTVSRESVEGDRVLQQQVNVNNQWSIDQFNQHANSINGVRSDVAQVKQDLANERHERKEQGKDLTAGVANAIAIGSHHFDTNYQGFQLSLSGGAYRGESAVSLSAGGAFTESVFGSISVSNDSRGHQGIGANTTWKF